MSNEAATPGPNSTPAPSEANTDPFLSELGGMLKDAKTARAKKDAAESGKVVEEPKAEPEAEAEATEAKDDEPEQAEEQQAEADEDDDEPKKTPDKAPEKVDQRTARGLEVIARREKALKQRESLFQQQQAEWRKAAEQAEATQKQFESWKERAKTNPVGALDELIGDLSPEEYDYVARQFHVRSKAATNPELRALAERERREREASSKADEAIRRAEEMEKRAIERERAVELEEKRREYVSAVEGMASENDTPLLAKALKKNAKQTREELRAVAGYLAQQSGEAWPDHAEVAKAWETWQRQQLADRFDIDPEVITGAKRAAETQTKPQTPAAGETKRPKTISSELGTNTKPKPTPKTPEELDEEIIRDMRAGKHKAL